MVCKNCNAEIADTAKFCTKCGTKVEVEAVVAKEVEEAPKAAPQAEPVAAPAAEKPAKEKKAKKEKVKKEKAKKGKGKLIAILSVAAVLVVAIVAGIIFAINTFPIKVSADIEKIDTKYKVVDEKIEFTSNQKIKEILYAVDPTDPADMKQYKAIKDVEAAKTVEIKLPDIAVKPGQGSIYFVVKGQFSTAKTIEVPYNYSLGFVAEIDADSLNEVADGIYEVRDQLIVKFKEGYGETKVKDLIKEYDGTIVGALYGDNEYQIKFSLDGRSLSSIISSLRADENVVSLYQDMAFLCDADAVPNDAEYSSDDWLSTKPSGRNWNLELIDAIVAWDYLNDAATSKVGVIDSMLDTDHEDIVVNQENVLTLQSNSIKTQEDIMRLYKSLGLTSDGMYSHGTHVAGTIASTANNGKGTTGINWKSDLHFANMWTYVQDGDDVKVYSSLTGFKYCLQYLVYSDCKVVNFSIGGARNTTASDADADEIEYINNIFKQLEEDGYDFLFVKAAGNSGKEASVDCWNRYLTGGTYSSKHTIIVGSVVNVTTHVDGTTPNYNLSYFSNYGDLVDIVAPGSDIYNTYPDNKYGNMSGTSMAAPHVTGVASLAWSINPSLTSAQVKDMLISQTKLYALRRGTTYPILNAGLVAKAAKAADTTEIAVPEYGYLVGSVRDVIADKLLSDVKVVLTNQTTNEVYVAYTGKDEAVLGLYEVLLTPGTYDITFEKTGYIKEEVYDVVIETGTSSYNALLEMVASEEGTFGIAQGKLFNAFNANGIGNATLSFRRGTNAKTGDIVFTTTTNEDGTYEAELSPGVYTVYAEAENYQSDYFSIVVIGREYTTEQNGSLTPILQEGEMRIVLTWGQTPLDVDAHLVGPGMSGGTFHVYYSDQNYYYNSELVANLDVDDRYSYGPETTTVYNMLSEGTYTFYVHDYSNRKAEFSEEMALSGVVVKLYLPGQGAPKTFNMPSMDGISWRVFSIVDGELVVHNDVTYTPTGDYTNVIE
ncbi:MAG: S8 family serine peptidase [Lachnospiraceae bacterium]|nr:S8 family serine peptidase [Lachnospiraceae bacterium]